MVLMTLLMAGQLCAGLHRHLLTALSPHLLILVPAIIIIPAIIVNAIIIVIAIIVIAINNIFFPRHYYFTIIAINSIILIITIFVIPTIRGSSMSAIIQRFYICQGEHYVGSVVRGTCDPGFVLVGEPVIRCTQVFY